MRVSFVLLLLALVLPYTSAVSEEIGTPDERMKKWQTYLENSKFRFPKREIGTRMLDSLVRFSANCELQIVRLSTPKRKIWFRFVRGKKEVLALRGHLGTVFSTFDETLYYAKYGATSPGCTVAAYDLTTGKKLWATDDLSRLGPFGHSAYGNQVFMRLSRLNNEVPGEPVGAAVIVTGHEGFGDYIAVLDRLTGIVLAHKIYRKGFDYGPPVSGGGFGPTKSRK